MIDPELKEYLDTMTQTILKNMRELSERWGAEIVDEIGSRTDKLKS